MRHLFLDIEELNPPPQPQPIPQPPSPLDALKIGEPGRHLELTPGPERFDSIYEANTAYRHHPDYFTNSEVRRVYDEMKQATYDHFENWRQQQHED